MSNAEWEANLPRCPHCGASITQSGDKKCPSCSKVLPKAVIDRLLGVPAEEQVCGRLA